MAATDSEPDNATQAAGLSQDERAELARLRAEVTELRRKQAEQPARQRGNKYHQPKPTFSGQSEGGQCACGPELLVL